MNNQDEAVRIWFELNNARQRERRLAAWLFLSAACVIIEAAALVVLLVQSL
jgi:hypothetical protein